MSRDEFASFDVDWIDFDSDGDLDLAICNPTQPGAIHRNDGGILTRAPVWYLPSANSFAWGDFDADGSTDVALALGGIFIYRNSAQSLELVQTILGAGDAALKWVDYDQDGDLDLSSANGDSVTIYANVDHAIQAIPVWVSDIAAGTLALDWGDYDGDGDPDLLVSRFNGRNAIYRNDRGSITRTPVWRSLIEAGGKDCQWIDVDSDGALDATFSNWGSLTVYMNSRGTVDSMPSQVVPEGTADAFAWADFDSDGDLDVATNGDALYRNDRGWLTRTPVWQGMSLGSDDVEWGDYDGDGDPDLAFAKSGSDAVYRNDEGTLAASTRDMEFPTTTYGDTTWQTLVLTNRSGGRLRIEGVTFSAGGFGVAEEVARAIHDTLILDADSSLATEIYFAPTSGESSAVMDVVSVGTTRQITGIRIMGRARPLSFEVQPLYPNGRVTAGSDVLVAVRMGDHVQVDSAVVHLRQGGSTEAQVREFRMVKIADPTNERHVATISADAIGRRGVEYVVEAFNGRLSRLSDRTRLRIATKSQPLPFVDRALEYRLMSLPFEMASPILGSFGDELGRMDVMQWRMFGYDAADSEYVEVPNDSMSSFEQGRGYWLVTRNDVQLDIGPATGISAATDSAFAIVLEPGFNLIGTPFLFRVSWDDVLVNNLTMSEARRLGLIDGPWRWLAGVGRYNDPLTDPVGTLEPFEAYWVHARTLATLHVPPTEAAGPIAGTNLSDSKVSARDGWSLEVAVQCGGVRDGGNYAAVRSDARTGHDPYDVMDPPMSPARSIGVYFPHSSWSEGRGAYAVDVRGEPDLSSDDRLDQLTGHDDFRGHVWSFGVAKNFSVAAAGDEAVLQFGGLESVPTDLAVELIDLDLGSRVNLREQGQYRFYISREEYRSEEDTRFQLVVGTKGFLSARAEKLLEPPGATMLHQNRPNPTQPPTLIRYELARPCRVALRLLDVRGAVVRVLEDRERPAGRFEIEWDGRNMHGERVSAGVYFVRLVAPGVSQTRKAVIVE